MVQLRCIIILVLLVVNSICNNEESHSVIIVGAGVSGIAAASKLLEHNVTNITILEAKHRIGGRVHTVNFGDGVVDLGAQWCHGQSDNVVYQMANKYGLLGSEGEEFKVFHSTKNSLNQAFVDELFEIHEKIYENPSKGNLSWGEEYPERYNEVIQKRYKNNPEKLKLATEAMSFFMKFILGMEGSFTPFEVSANSDYIECEGNLHMNWKGRGYKTILDLLTKKYPNPKDQLPIDQKISFNKEVVEIHWEKEKPVEVKCKDGSVYHADHVIVTVSLGVLKHSHRTMFSPSLPEEKIRAIDDLGFDAVGKVFLYFPSHWWKAKKTDKFTSFTFLWTEEDKKTYLDSSEGANSWLFDIDGLVEIENPTVLMAWMAGPSIPKIESLTDDDVMDGIMSLIYKFIGPFYKNITSPTAIRRHGWYSDPHVRGSYSFQTIKSRLHKESPEVVLSKPLGGAKLLFAGEATNPIHYATVHGALETGQREAQRIIDHYAKDPNGSGSQKNSFSLLTIFVVIYLLSW